MPTIAHISDLHLQLGKPDRQAQVEPIFEAINQAEPDLVVISGDVTDDGWDDIEELKWAKGWLNDRINGDWFAVPGNHDVGNFASLKKEVVDQDRVKAWEKVFDHNPGHLLACPRGSSCGGWRILGLNSMVLGSGLQHERLQEAWLNQQDKVSDKTADLNLCTAVFLHAPLCVNHIDEPAKDETDYWLGPAEPRRSLYQRLQNFDAKLIGTGHVHQTRTFKLDNVLMAWAPPASGTWVHAPGLPNPEMPAKTGFFLHDLGGDGSVTTRLIQAAPMQKLYHHEP